MINKMMFLPLYLVFRAVFLQAGESPVCRYWRDNIVDSTARIEKSDQEYRICQVSQHDWHEIKSLIDSPCAERKADLSHLELWCR